jgi:DNA-3-methyladenine glycosylase
VTLPEADDVHRLGRRAPWPRAALTAPAVEVAPALLGALLVRVEDDGTETIVRIVETEAYPQTDPASHSHRGRTPRNAVMFGAPGHAYVYFSYGMHHCMNVSCEEVGVGAAVLFRAAVAVAGQGHLRRRRGGRHRDRDLLSGPGRLTQALGIDRSFDGLDLTDPHGRLRLETDGFDPPGRVVAGPRVGIRHAADVPWRFHLAGVPEVSRYVRHPEAPPSGRG